jgi:hypothetical protein
MQPEGCGPLGGSTDGRLRRTAAFRLLHRSDDLLSKSLSVFEDKWRPGKAHALEIIDPRPDGGR